MAGTWGNAHIKIGSYHAERWSTSDMQNQSGSDSDTEHHRHMQVQRHCFDRSPLPQNTFQWFMLMTDALIKDSNTWMNPPTKLTLTPGKQSKAKQSQAFSTVWNLSLCVRFISKSPHLVQEHTQASNSCKLFEKASNAELALGTPDYDISNSYSEEAWTWSSHSSMRFLRILTLKALTMWSNCRSVSKYTGKFG